MLCHLPDECMKYGPLDSFSAWKYENALAAIKRSVQGAPSQPLVTAVNRLTLQPYYMSRGYIYQPKTVPGLLKKNSADQFEVIELAKFVLKQNEVDCYFGVEASGARRHAVYKFHVAEREASSGRVDVLAYRRDRPSTSFYTLNIPDNRTFPRQTISIESSDLGVYSIGACHPDWALIRIPYGLIKYKYIVHKSYNHDPYTVAYRMI
jgi:hypothetical protein